MGTMKQKLDSIKKDASKVEAVDMSTEKVDISDLDNLSDSELDKLLDEASAEDIEDDDDDDGDDINVESEDNETEETEDSISESEEDAEDSDDSETEESDKSKKPKPTTVPLKKLEEERKKRQAIEAELEAQKMLLAKYREKEDSDEITKYREEKKQKYIDKGYEEDLAESLAEDLTELYQSTRKPAETATVKADKYISAVAELKVSDEYFDNADAYSDVIIEKMKKFEITAREAYGMVVDPTVRAKELQQRKLSASSAKTGKTNSKASIPSSSAKQGSTSDIVLSKKQEREFQALKREDSSWTRKEYKELMVDPYI